MKGKDWKFKGFIPDMNDLDAKLSAWNQFRELEKRNPLKMNDAEREIFLFCCGFNRGAAWMKDKMKGEDDELIIGEKF